MSDYPQSDLTLSAAPALLPEDAEVAEYIAHELDAIDTLTELGYGLTARVHLARLFDFVLGAD